MWWLLVPVALIAYPFACGYFVGFLVFLTPGLQRKIALAQFLIAGPFYWLDEELGAEVAVEVEWIVRGRYGENRAEYRALVEQAWGVERKK